METILPLLANYGFGAIMSGVVVLLHWHTVRVTIPSLFDMFRRELAAERKQHHDDHESLRAAVEKLQSAVLGGQK